jgi:hypothetical protein
MNNLILYVDNIEKMKILKKKIPKVKWFGGEDVVEWHPKFPFIIHLEDGYISYSAIFQADLETIRNAKISSKTFFNLKNGLELE